MKKKFVSIIGLFLALALLQTGCGGSSTSADKYASPMEAEDVYYEAAAEESAIVNTSGGTGSSLEIKETNRKLIRNVELTVETENYEELMTGLETEIEKIGGYIEYKDAYHGDLYSKYEGSSSRNASLTVRIPAGKLDQFTGKVGEIGNITYESQSVEDVTLQYVDLSSHKKMLQTQQERLLELMEQAETMEDIITIESRLSEVRYEIETMESQLRTYDNLVDYSTVKIQVNEVERYTPQPKATIKDRILQGLSENTYKVLTGVMNFFVELIIALPIIILYAVAGFLIWLIVKAIRRFRGSLKKNQKQESHKKFLGKLKQQTQQEKSEIETEE